MPPNGCRASEAVAALTNTAPVVMRLDIRTARSFEAVQMLTDRPKGVALARRMQSSSSSATAMAAAGPKVSSSNTAMPGPALATTVGS